MTSLVLDTSAVLAYIQDEPGSMAIPDQIADLLLSSVNLAEAVGVMMRRGLSFDDARKNLSYLDFRVVDFDRGLAEETGALAQRTRSLGLSLGDRACLALAMRESLPALTADRAWRGLDVGVEIRLIR